MMMPSPIAYLAYLPAKKSGISVPQDMHAYDPASFPHWHTLVERFDRASTLGIRKGFADRIEEAQLIARLPGDKLVTGEIDCDALLPLGLIRNS
jgi:hypothetical protein